MEQFIQFLKDNNYEFLRDVSFKVLTTYKVGGDANIVIYPKDKNELKNLILYIKKNNIKYKVFGNGSNILPSDDNYDGAIIKLNKLNNYEIYDDYVYAEAGVNLMILSNKISKMGYTNLEFATGIPGSIGGAIYMNAGAYLENISNIVISVEVLDNNCDFITLTNEEMQFSYRKSRLMKDRYICISAKLKIKKNGIEEINALIEERKEKRKQTQPLEYPSAGSVFRNPKDNYAAKLIQDLGLKGLCCGDAEISHKHANFIVNTGKAKSSDIKYLIDYAKKKVKDEYNIDLIIEQELFNWGINEK